ncbi:MAG: type II toxin-antitoxin system PemK/MazF family toxin [Solirubrobacterales bacterium]
MVRGDIWWYESPRVPVRPYVILTRSPAIPMLTQILAVPTTRTVRGIPTEVALGPDDGMPEVCVVSLDNMTSIRGEFCLSKIATLDDVKMRQICEALTTATDC